MAKTRKSAAVTGPISKASSGEAVGNWRASASRFRKKSPEFPAGGFPSADTLPIFLSNCTVGSINANTVCAPQTFCGIRIATCDKVSVNGNTIHVGTHDFNDYVQALIIQRCKNCSAVANLIDVPAAPHPVGVIVGDDLHISSNIIVQNNLIVGPGNPAVVVDTDPSANVIVIGNLAPSAMSLFQALLWQGARSDKLFFLDNRGETEAL